MCCIILSSHALTLTDVVPPCEPDTHPARDYQLGILLGLLKYHGWGHILLCSAALL